jgi:orotidine-5'-phosphate decarboxylase
MKSPIILAMDTNDLETAKKWIDNTNGVIGVYKLGLEFFLKFGREGVASIQKETDCEIFLDLKLHDIPNTVGAAAKQVAALKPKFLTVHASGGLAMINAAVMNAPDTDITAVTILTSLSQQDMSDIGFEGTAQSRAVELAKLAVSAGAKAIVCSPLEIQAIRAVVPTTVSIITPGIRPSASAGSDDQKRTMDPKSAIKAGANYLVIGRPITGAEDMASAAKSILEEAIA